MFVASIMPLTRAKFLIQHAVVIAVASASFLFTPPARSQMNAQTAPATATSYPAAARRPVTDTFIGTAGPRKVTEDYRWLETLDDPAVKDWVTLQNTATRRYLDALPARIAIRDELKQLIGAAPVTRDAFSYAGGKLFARKRQPPKNQPMLVMLDAGRLGTDSLDTEKVVVDPHLRNDKGTTAIDWYEPSHDGTLVAVSLSDNGSEKGTLRFFETDTGNELPDVVPRVQNPTGGGSVAWNADSSGVWFTRYPAPMERPAEDAGFFQQVWFHKLGTRSTLDTVTRVMAKSKDGTDVPVNIVAKKGVALDGSNPTLLTAYGGYGLSQRPYYSRRVMFWLSHGGVYAMANVRGGGEFGEEWHLAGNLTKKQNVFDDFAGAAQMLVDRRYTSPKKLAIEGGSNGGLLMGAELVQHPEMFGAVVSHVGIYDRLRVELTPNGAFNVPEFGTVKDPAQFDALYAYSPLHRVEDGKAYPPVMFLTGINDGRVDPWQSLKMTARMQAANPKGRPVLLRVASDAGHGQGMSLSSSIEQDADSFAFLFESLGMAMPVGAK